MKKITRTPVQNTIQPKHLDLTQVRGGVTPSVIDGLPPDNIQIKH